MVVRLCLVKSLVETLGIQMDDLDLDRATWT
jgi:hypothetical protein